MAARLAPERDRVVGFALDDRDRLTTGRAHEAGAFRCGHTALHTFKGSAFMWLPGLLEVQHREKEHDNDPQLALNRLQFAAHGH